MILWSVDRQGVFGNYNLWFGHVVQYIELPNLVLIFSMILAYW